MNARTVMWWVVILAYQSLASLWLGGHYGYIELSQRDYLRIYTEAYLWSFILIDLLLYYGYQRLRNMIRRPK